MKKLLRIFRFGVESAAVNRAVEACGWQARITLVESIKEADLILAAKCSSTGKHRNLAQVRYMALWVERGAEDKSGRVAVLSLLCYRC